MSESEEGRITDEGVDKMRRLIGYPNPTVRTGIMKLPWNTEVTSDAIRHYTECSLGDMNPLYTDPTYGPGTRWSTHIAPPSFDQPPHDPLSHFEQNAFQLTGTSELPARF